MGILSDLYVRVGANLTEFKAGMGKVHAATAEASNGFSFMGAAAVAGGALVIGAAVGIGLGLSKAAESAAEFQAKMTLIQTQAGRSASEVALMTKAVLALAGPTATAPDVLADAMYHIASTGIPAAEALQALQIAAEGAKVGQANLVDVTNALDAVLVAGMPEAKNMSMAMGELNAIVGAGDMKMQDLADAMGTGIIATAKTFGLSLKDVGAALAVLGDNNIRGAEAGTKLRMSFALLAVQSGAAAKDLAKIGITTDELGNDMRSGGLVKALEDLQDHLKKSGLTATEQADIISKAFGGGKSGATIQLLLQQMDRLKQKEIDVGKGGTSFGDAWAATTANVSFKMDQLQASLSVAGIKLGTVLLPYVSQFLGLVTPLVPVVADWATNMLNKLIPAVEDLYKKFQSVEPFIKWAFDHWPLLAPFVAAWAAQQVILNAQLAISAGLSIWAMIGPYIGLLAEARSATELWTAVQLLFDAAMDANPIGIVIVAIGALVVGVIWAYKNVGWFRDIVNGLWNDVLKPFGAWLQNVLPPILQKIGDFFSWLGTQAHDLMNSIGGIINGIGQIGNLGGIFGGGHASGGYTAAGTTYLVGEHGPELFTSAVSGSIIPTEQLFGGGGGSGVTEIHVHVDQGAFIDGPSLDILTNKIAQRLAFSTAL